MMAALYFKIFWVVLMLQGIECTPTTESRIVSKVRLNGDCVDGTGNVVADGSSWTSAPGVCDNNICHHEVSGNYIVQERCRPLGPNENPDPVNCQTVTSNNQAFPACCPKLACAKRNALTTLSPTVCLDMATTWSCEFWKNETSGCQPGTNDALYEYAKNYCHKTCGLC